ncbi:Protein of unknown function (DUF3119) [Xenococcus sp. PCC 7305]|uniref:DUF3119 family protein n=1 Tax=Xenococcus sp. PCC 7305 TaxID=102125 RepID=UPI0002ACEC0B|nr:DUF3119 family protein [Xenococcus sp. PCC 7305]ELS05468.1 Protein of unknown function (DUF3119) [Xenococcus sp. PCC 7305]
MVTKVESADSAVEIIELTPSYRIPIFLVAFAIPLAVVNVWLAIGPFVFGLFLMFQTIAIRLKFTNHALDVYYSGKQIRSFPYQEWSNWRIFWQPVPILFYFREVKSIHFLPIIFDPKTLVSCLERFCPQQELGNG